MSEIALKSGKFAVFDAIADILKAVKELNLGVGGFFALCFMAFFVWGAKRASSFASGLSGEWKRLIDEGVKVREALADELEEARAAITAREAVIKSLREEYDELAWKYTALEARLRNLENGVK